MGTSAPENGIYGISGLWDLGIMGFEICGILVLWEKGKEEGRNRERRVGQEPWSIISSFFCIFHSNPFLFLPFCCSFFFESKQIFFPFLVELWLHIH